MTNEVTEASDDKLKRLAARAWDMGLHKPFETVKSDALTSQEPAVAYRHHEQAAVAKLALVDDKPAKHEAKNEALEAQKAIALVNIDALIARADGSQKENLEKLKRKIEGAKSLEALATLANAAQSEGLTDGTDILETPQEQKARLWNDIKQNNKEISDDMEELYRRGYVSQAQYEQWKKERERLDKMDVNDPARLAGEKALNEQTHAIAQNAGEQAAANGDNVGAGIAHQTEKSADKLDKNFVDLDLVNQTINKQGVGQTQDDSFHTLPASRSTGEITTKIAATNSSADMALFNGGISDEAKNNENAVTASASKTRLNLSYVSTTEVSAPQTVGTKPQSSVASNLTA